MNYVDRVTRKGIAREATSVMLEIVGNELGWDHADLIHLTRYVLRLIIASALGAVIGVEREAKGRVAGLRTHMLVALGAALFTIVPAEAAATPDFAAIVKGIAAGVGFLGAGAILKKTEDSEIQGVTTAAGIWLTAAVGFATGAGWIGLAVVATGAAWVILYMLSFSGISLNSAMSSQSSQDPEDQLRH